jgi:hypothetical protein
MKRRLEPGAASTVPLYQLPPTAYRSAMASFFATSDEGFPDDAPS